MTHAAFATLGNVTIDDLVFDDGSTMWKVPGGNAIYSGLGVALWGERPSVIAPVGKEYPTELLGDRVDISKCRLLDRTLRDWGLYEEDGSRIFVFRSTTRNWLEYSPTLADLDGFTCDFAHLAPLRWELQIDLAEKLRANGTKVIGVDPDDRYLGELKPQDTAKLLGLIDLFLPSKQDAEAMFPTLDSVDAIRALRDLAPDLPLIAIKQGANGVIMHAAGDADYLSIPTIAETVVDTTGAGDAFSGGTLAGFARSGSALRAVLQGSVSGSYAVAQSGPGALVAATVEEAEERLKRLSERVTAHAL